MALVKGTNSYVTVAEADVYFADRLDVATWTAATTRKSQALVTATMLLDGLSFVGVAVSEAQALAFPRIGSYFDPRYGMEILFDDVDTPERVITATCELAFHLVNNESVLDDTGTIENISVGSISLTNISNAPHIPSSVKKIVRPLLENGGASMWWRAN